MAKTHELLPTQQTFLAIDHDLPLDVAIYQGGFGSGKTYAGALLGVMLCIMFPGIKGLVVAQTYPKLIDTTLEMWKNHLCSAGMFEHKHWNYNITDKILKFKNGSVVYFRQCAEPEKLRSLEVGFIEIEEASDLTEVSFLELLGRLRQSELRGGAKLPRRRLFCHTNPEANKGWIWKHFVEKTKQTVEYSDETTEFNVSGHTGKTRYIRKVIEEDVEGKKVRVCYRLVLAPTIQNFHNDDSYIANMKAVFDPEMYRIMVMGEFGYYTSGLVTKGFCRERQVVPLAYNPQYPLHITCDFNVDPNCWFIAQHYDGNIYFLDEIVQEHTNTELCMMQFMRKYPPHEFKNIIINGDASGGNNSTSAVRGDNYAIMLNLLRANGYSAKPYPEIRSKNPDIIQRINAWNAKMCNAYGEYSIYFNAVYEDGVYRSLTPRLIHSIENLKFNPGDNTINEPSRADIRKDASLKFDPHVFDGASYLVEYYYPIVIDTNPKKAYDKPRNTDRRFNLVGDFE